MNLILLVFLSLTHFCLSLPLNNELVERRLSVVFLGDDWVDNIYVFRCTSGELQWSVTSNALAPQSYLKTTWYKHS